jgi:hypothetical protein
MLLWFIPVALSLWLLASVNSLLQNIERAKSTSLPIVISPIGVHNPIWMLSQHALMSLIEKLPFGLGSFTDLNKHDWNYHDKYRMHQNTAKCLHALRLWELRFTLQI